MHNHFHFLISYKKHRALIVQNPTMTLEYHLKLIAYVRTLLGIDLAKCLMNIFM